MKIKIVCTWLLVFSALASTTYYALQPQGEAMTALAHAAEKKHSALVLPHEEIHNNIIKRIFHRLHKKNLVCTINSTQAAYLADRYETETETITVNGDEVVTFKIKRAAPATTGAIRRYLRETGNERCVVVPARSWYYVVLGGVVS